MHQGVPDADAIKQTNPQMLLRKARGSWIVYITCMSGHWWFR